MSYPRYPEYRDSGVEWLGEVPSGWIQARIKDLAMINPSKGEATHLPPDTNVSFVPMEAIGEDGSLDLSRIRQLSDVSSGYTYFREGDVITAKITPCFENGKGCVASGLVNEIGFATTEVIPLRPRSNASRDFLYFLIHSAPFRTVAEGSMYGSGGQKRVSDSFVAGYHLALPPLPEQRQIAAFLDRECTAMDDLMAKQQRLIALLKEKRQALISHTVTKGLDPNARLKDSGIEWLGQVPEEWAIIRGRYIFKKLELPPLSTDGVVTSFRDGQVTLRTNRRTEGFTIAFIEHGYQHVREGDLVIHGMDAFAGAIGVSESDGKCTPEYSVLTSVGNNVQNEYFAKILRLMAQRDFIFVICPSVRERAPRFRFNSFKEVRLPLPPLPEQRAIVAYLDSAAEKIDTLVAKAESAIALLKERRTALISAAVTGKIDVRNL